jgi:WhiB family transcriptional regulator, redox-sensing transcriptional regulator
MIPRRGVDWTWTDQAACAGEPVDMFFARDGETAPRRRRREAAALAICNRCPVRPACHAYATTHREDYGVWAGTTEDQRAAERRHTTDTRRTA